MSDEPQDTPQEPQEPQEPADWRESISPELRESNENILNRFDSLDKFVTAHIEQHRLLSGEKVPKPGPNATEEQMSAFYDALGRPKDSDGYEIEADGRDENFLKWYKGAAHKMGLTQQQFQGIMESFEGFAAETQESLQRENTVLGDKAEAHLRAKWGSDFDKNMEKTKLALLQYGPGDDMESRTAFFERLDHGYGNDPFLVEAFHALAQHLIETDVGDVPSTQAETVDTINARINEIQKNPAYNDKGAAEHATLLAEMDALFRKKHQLQQ